MVIIWFPNKYIDMKYVLPRKWPYGNESKDSSDSDDDEGIPRVNFKESFDQGSEERDGSKGKKKKVNIDLSGRFIMFR